MGVQELIHTIQDWLGTRNQAIQIIRDFYRSLLLIVDPQSLQASIAARMREIFRARCIVIFQRNASGAEFLATFQDGLSETDQQVVQPLRRGHLARWLHVNETCLVVEQSPGVVDYLSVDERDLLQRLDIRLCVPLISLNRLSGIVLLGAPEGGDSSIRPNQIELLNLLAGQAALALENAALYVAQEERLKRLHRAERLATVGHLAAGVAHEIRNPLTSIRSTMQYIQQAFGDDDERRELISELLSEVDRIDRTVDNLMNLTRPRAFQPVAVDLGEMLEQSLTLVEVQARRNGVDIDRLVPEERFFIQADRDQLKEVFINLFVNALQAMPDGGRLSVKVHPWSSPASASDESWVEVQIMDSGKGIDPENLDSVFNPFFTTKPTGTGLGLASSHSIIQQHDGQLELGNRPEGGACAMVRFPLLDSQS